MTDLIHLLPLILVALTAACMVEREWWAAEKLALLTLVFAASALIAGPPAPVNAPDLQAARLDWSARHAPAGR